MSASDFSRGQRDRRRLGRNRHVAHGMETQTTKESLNMAMTMTIEDWFQSIKLQRIGVCNQCETWREYNISLDGLGLSQKIVHSVCKGIEDCSRNRIGVLLVILNCRCTSRELIRPIFFIPDDVQF